MLDLLYDLLPEESISCIEGHLLVLVTNDTPLAAAVALHVEERVARLDDTSEFLIATVAAEIFPDLTCKTQELPALFHFMDGKSRSVNHGADDCVEFFEEFIIANRCKRNGKHRS